MAFDLQFVDSIGDIYPTITDTFTRTVSGGWGPADTGQVWTVEGTAANASVSGGVGQHSITAIGVDLHTVMASTASDSEDVWSVTCPVVATGQSIVGMRTARRADVANTYRVEVSFGVAGALGLRLRKVVGGTVTSLAFAAPLTYTAGAKVWVRQQLIGSSFRARYWLAGTVEPGGWTLTAVDTDLASGGNGFTSTVNSGNTNTLPVVLAYDNLTMSAPASVRLDLNDDVTWRTLAEGTDFGMPALSRAVSSTLLTDGDHVSAAAYGNRVLTLTLRFQGTGFDAAAAAVQALTREVDRPSNFLRYRPGTTNPLFFRTLRSEVSAVQWDPFSQVATVSLLAEPFALGLKETLPSVTVWNDPAEGTTINANPFFETSAASWTASGGTAVRSTAQFHEGVASLLLTPSGVAPDPEVSSESVPMTTGLVFRGSAWVRCATARTVQVFIKWRDAADALISTTSSGFLPVAANTWTLLTVTGIAPALCTQGRLAVGMSSTPPATDLLYVDEARLWQSGTPAGMCFDVTGVKGDVPAPVVLRRPTTGIGAESLFAVRRRGNPNGVPLLLQAEYMTQGTDTATQPNAAAFSGSGNNSSRVSFTTTPGYMDRLSVTAWPSVASVDARGTYRVFARLRRNGTTSTIKAKLRVAGVDLDEVTITGTAVQMVDLGLVSVPTGADPVHDGASGVELPARGPSVALWASRSGAGTDTLDVDYLLWVPADDRLSIVHWPVTTAGSVVLDGVHDLAYASSSDVTSGTPGYHVGGMPVVSPGVTNRIYVVNEVGVGLGEPSFPASTTFDGYYWPRYLMVRGLSS